MRKWHRWLSVIFGVVLLWIAVTGMLSQVVPVVRRGRNGSTAKNSGKSLWRGPRPHRRKPARIGGTRAPAQGW